MAHPIWPAPEQPGQHPNTILRPREPLDVLNTVRRLMGLPATYCGRVLNEIRLFRATLPFINQHVLTTCHSAHSSPVCPTAPQFLRARVCPACPTQSHSRLKRPWPG